MTTTTGGEGLDTFATPQTEDSTTIQSGQSPSFDDMDGLEPANDDPQVQAAEQARVDYEKSTGERSKETKKETKKEKKKKR